MTISNYDNLKKEVLVWSHRGDLGTRFDTFLQLCEVDIYSNPDEGLKILSLGSIATTTTQTDSRFLSLPDGANIQRKLTIEINGINCDIQYTSPGNIQTFEDEQYSGVPLFFTISNNQIELDRLPDDEYTITINYTATDEPLTVDNQSNVTLLRYPNIYLYGCLYIAFGYATDTEQESKYYIKFVNAIKYANEREKDIKYPTGMNIKAPRVV